MILFSSYIKHALLPSGSSPCFSFAAGYLQDLVIHWEATNIYNPFMLFLSGKVKHLATHPVF